MSETSADDGGIGPEGEGWQRVDTTSFSAAIGSLWTRETPDGSEIALCTDGSVANNRADTVHGGALMTLADIALGFGACSAMGSTNCSTVQMQYQFVAAAKVGESVFCRPEIVRKTSQLVFVRGLFESGGRTVGSADAIFKFFEPRPG